MSDRERRIHELTYSCESRTEMCERVVDMEDECERLREQMANERERFANVRDECERLRVLAKHTLLCSEGDVRCEGCPLRDASAKGPHVVCSARKLARELGVDG